MDESKVIDAEWHDIEDDEDDGTIDIWKSGASASAETKRISALPILILYHRS